MHSCKLTEIKEIQSPLQCKPQPKSRSRAPTLKEANAQCFGYTHCERSRWLAVSQPRIEKQSETGLGLHCNVRTDYPGFSVRTCCSKSRTRGRRRAEPADAVRVQLWSRPTLDICFPALSNTSGIGKVETSISSKTNGKRSLEKDGCDGEGPWQPEHMRKARGFLEPRPNAGGKRHLNTATERAETAPPQLQTAALEAVGVGPTEALS